MGDTVGSTGSDPGEGLNEADTDPAASQTAPVIPPPTPTHRSLRGPHPARSTAHFARANNWVAHSRPGLGLAEEKCGSLRSRGTRNERLRSLRNWVHARASTWCCGVWI